MFYHFPCTSLSRRSEYVDFRRVLIDSLHQCFEPGRYICCFRQSEQDTQTHFLFYSCEDMDLCLTLLLICLCSPGVTVNP